MDQAMARRMGRCMVFLVVCLLINWMSELRASGEEIIAEPKWVQGSWTVWFDTRTAMKTGLVPTREGDSSAYICRIQINEAYINGWYTVSDSTCCNVLDAKTGEVSCANRGVLEYLFNDKFSNQLQWAESSSLNGSATAPFVVSGLNDVVPSWYICRVQINGESNRIYSVPGILDMSSRQNCTTHFNGKGLSSTDFELLEDISFNYTKAANQILGKETQLQGDHEKLQEGQKTLTGGQEKLQAGVKKEVEASNKEHQDILDRLQEIEACQYQDETMEELRSLNEGQVQLALGLKKMEHTLRKLGKDTKSVDPSDKDKDDRGLFMKIELLLENQSKFENYFKAQLEETRRLNNLLLLLCTMIVIIIWTVLIYINCRKCVRTKGVNFSDTNPLMS